MENLRPCNKITAVVLSAIFMLSGCQVNEQRLPESRVTHDVIDQTKTLFPMANYPQSIDKWIISDGVNGERRLMDDQTQKRYFTALLSRFYGQEQQDRSPWNAKYINRVLKNEPGHTIQNSINTYLLANSRSWGENFRENTENWKLAIKNNIPVDFPSHYRHDARAITLRETLVRVLPTSLPAFHDPREAGEGYPFDSLQMSALKPATPVYLLGESVDKSWAYILSPSVMGWVKTEDIVAVNDNFVTRWHGQANKHLGTFIKDDTPVVNGESFAFIGRVGTLLPYTEIEQGRYIAWIPVKGDKGTAEIKTVRLPQDSFTAMPFTMNVKNMALLISTMINKPYGWGNTLFYNDCSAEMRALLMPFGVLLPRNSAAQIQAAPKVVDLSKASTAERLEYLKKEGKAFTTLIYIPGHIMLYIGNTEFNGENVPLTYQNIWGLRPANQMSRSIIGGSAILPLLSVYPENPDLLSLAAKTQFKLGFLSPE